MTWADQDNRDERELYRVAITGKGEEWARLQENIYGIVDVIAQRIQDASSVDLGKIEGSAEALKDLSRLAANWARAKIEKPSLENEKLKAEIASEFAEAKKRWAKALKTEAETRQIESTTRNQELVASLDNLERLLRIASLMSNVTFARIGGDGHLLIGPSPAQIGEPNGDVALLGENQQEDPSAEDG